MKKEKVIKELSGTIFLWALGSLIYSIISIIKLTNPYLITGIFIAISGLSYFLLFFYIDKKNKLVWIILIILTSLNLIYIVIDIVIFDFSPGHIVATILAGYIFLYLLLPSCRNHFFSSSKQEGGESEKTNELATN